MSNPTREEVELDIKYLSDHYGNHGSCCECTTVKKIGKAYLRALDMRDEIAQILESEIGPWYKPKEMKRVIQHFDEGGA